MPVILTVTTLRQDDHQEFEASQKKENKFFNISIFIIPVSAFIVSTTQSCCLLAEGTKTSTSTFSLSWQPPETSHAVSVPCQPFTHKDIPHLLKMDAIRKEEGVLQCCSSATM